MSDDDREASPAKPKRKRAPVWVRVARVLAVFVVLTGILKVTGWGDRLFFYPVRSEYEPPAWAEDVWFESGGRRLHGWFYPARRPAPEDGSELGPAPTIVHCHGNAFNISRHADFVDFLPAAGFNVFIFDYRSYGMSDKGPLNRDGLIDDAGAALDYVFSRDDVDPERVGVYGLSLGGTIGLAAAAEDERVRAVCSVATFCTWKSVAGDYLPLIGPWLITPGRDAADSAAALGDRPLLLLHGTADPIVRHHHAPTIHEAATAAGVHSTFQSFEGVGHVNWIDESPELRNAIKAFFAEHLSAEPAAEPTAEPVAEPAPEPNAD